MSIMSRVEQMREIQTNALVVFERDGLLVECIENCDIGEGLAQILRGVTDDIEKMVVVEKNKIKLCRTSQKETWDTLLIRLYLISGIAYIRARTPETEDYRQKLIELQREALDVFVCKNTDYGDAFETYGFIGVLVRIGDKIHRIQNIMRNGMALVKDESVRDTLLDLHNYSAIALMLVE